jgi:hypothetical protein
MEAQFFTHSEYAIALQASLYLLSEEIGISRQVLPLGLKCLSEELGSYGLRANELEGYSACSGGVLIESSGELHVENETHWLTLLNMQLLKHPTWQPQGVIILCKSRSLCAPFLIFSWILNLGQIFNILRGVPDLMNVANDLAVMVFNLTWRSLRPSNNLRRPLV